MSYNDFSECTLTDQERRDEVSRIVQMILGGAVSDRMEIHHRRFITQMIDREHPVSVKQLFYARDILSRYT